MIHSYSQAGPLQKIHIVQPIAESHNFTRCDAKNLGDSSNTRCLVYTMRDEFDVFLLR